VAKNSNTSAIILGASKPEQLKENLKALEVLPKLNDDIMERIEKILDNHPAPEVGLFYQVMFISILNVSISSQATVALPWTPPSIKVF